MNRSVSDNQAEILFFESHCCPSCGAMCSPQDGCHDRSVAAVWECSDDLDCGKEFTVRQLVKYALQRAGMMLRVVGEEPAGAEELEPAG